MVGFFFWEEEDVSSFEEVDGYPSLFYESVVVYDFKGFVFHEVHVFEEDDWDFLFWSDTLYGDCSYVFWPFFSRYGFSGFVYYFF
ncbi:MAG: hypothetical protein ACTSRF_15825 [Candidatus Freyarchaeota archaeon]